MSYNVNELDNRVDEYLSSGLQSAEEWRRQKPALPARDPMSLAKLLGVAATGAERTAATVGQMVGGIQVWFAGSSELPEKGRETQQGNLASQVHVLLCLIGHRSAKLGAWLEQKGLPHLTLAHRVGRSDC